MSSSDIAISPVEAQKLLKYAGVADPGVTTPERLQKIMDTIKINIREMGSQGFTKNAMTVEGSPQYIWAHTTAPGIIWLWGQQDADTRTELLNSPKLEWQNHQLSPSPDAPLDEGFTISVSTSPSASRASDSAAGTGAVSVPPFSFGSSPPSSAFSFGSSSGSIPPTTSSHFSFGSSPDSGPFSVGNSPTSQPRTPGGGYRKRRTRKTRRKSSRRGRSRSRHIRRKKTHHRRHRR
jgi:hypothetical protein